MSSWKTVSLAGALLLAIGLWLATRDVPDPFVPRARADAPADRGAGELPRVEVVEPERRTILRRTRLAGELKPDREAWIHSRVRGQVKPHPAEIGTRVNAGDVLVELDVPDLDMQVATAAAGVEAAVAAVTRASALAAVTREECERALATARQAAAGARAAEAGLAEAKAEVEVAATVDARIRAVVERSPNLVAQEDVDRARGDLEVARARLERQQELLAQAGEQAAAAAAEARAAEARCQTAQADIAAAQAGEALARARLDEAEGMQGFARIQAPIAGVVAERRVDTGAMVKPGAGLGEGLVRLVHDDRLRCRLFVADVDAPHVAVGKPAVLHVPGREPVEGQVKRVAGALDAATRTMEVEVEVDNRVHRLPADSFVRVELFLEEIPDALVLPATCVKTSKRKSHVLVVDADGVVRRRSVQIGADDGAWVEIRGGLEGGERVISRGGGTVAEGERAVAVARTAAGGGQ